MSLAPSFGPFEMEVTADAADIDQLGHVNNIVYLRWVQDVAVAHWYAAATAAQKACLVWVVAKHEIEYRRPALSGDELVIRTWVGEADARLFERHTAIVRKSDGKLLARAVSKWAPVDIATGRRVKAGADVYEMFSNPDHAAMGADGRAAPAVR